MTLSKLEIFLEILRVLRSKGPMKSPHIIYSAKVNQKIINEYLIFLVSQGLVEQVTDDTIPIYSVTQSGKTILKYFDIDRQTLPVVE